MRRSETFEDVSLISGVDFKEDGRGFVLLDFDQDGDLDLGVTSNQYPRFRLIENRLPDVTGAKSIRIRLEGGNKKSKANPEASPRDAVGARIIVKTLKDERMFQLSCGEGFSIQNSRNIHVGVGDSDQIPEIRVLWPSGQVSAKTNIKAGSTTQISEPIHP